MKLPPRSLVSLSALGWCALCACENRSGLARADAAADLGPPAEEAWAPEASRDEPDVEVPDAEAPADAPQDEARCLAGQVFCEGRCIPEGACCGLPDSSYEERVEPRFDDRAAALTERVELTQEFGYDLSATSALVAHAGRLWFTYASRGCGARTVTFTPTPAGDVTDIDVRCESVAGPVTAVSLTRDRDGLIGCFSNPTRGADTVRCGRWSAGPGTWAQRGPSYPVISARWMDSEAEPVAAWSTLDGADPRLGFARFDRDLELVGERVIERTADTVTATAVAGDVRWLLRQPANRARGPILERLRGEERLAAHDLGALGWFGDWEGSLAPYGRGVALVTQTRQAVILWHADDAGVRGRRVLGTDASNGRGQLLPFEGGWVYAGRFRDFWWVLRMDCAGRLREAPLAVMFEGSQQYFSGFAPSPDGHGFWMLTTEFWSGTHRSVRRVSW